MQTNNEVDESGAPDTTAPGTAQSVTGDIKRHSATVESAKGGGIEQDSNEQQALVKTTPEDTFSPPVKAKEADSTEDVKPPPREHNLEQELVDYEVEEGDMMPIEKQENVKQSTQTGDKPQPPKISWNEWAGADSADLTKRTSESKEPEKQDGALTDVRRVPVSDSRKHREDTRDGRGPSGRYGRSDGSRFHKDNRRVGRDQGRDRSPYRRPHRNSNSRSNDVPLRRGSMTPSHAGMPPGMNYGKASTPHFMHSGPMETMHPSARPMAARRMPPGLGVTGSAPRTLPRPSQHPPPVDNRRGIVRDARMRRSRSPLMKCDRPPRQMSPPRYDRYPRRPPSPPRNQEPLPPPVNARPRSPGVEVPMPFPDGAVIPRDVQGGRPQVSRVEIAPVQYRQRMDGPPIRPRDTAPASPRRFIPPEKRPVLQRQPPHRGDLNPDFNRGFPNNPSRNPAPGRWVSPPREHPRRPVSPTMHRSGPSRRSPPPPPIHTPLKRHPREPSPPFRQRREMEGVFRRREEPGRPEYFSAERDRRPYGPRMEPEPDRRLDMPPGRYGEHRRDPPSSPGRTVKRQRQSPTAEQRFHHEPGHHRNDANSPHQNPPNPALHYPETECAWYYVDPQGNTQGPCTIEQFRSWLRTLADDPQFADEHKQFMSVEVWKDGVQKKQLMTELLEHNIP